MMVAMLDDKNGGYYHCTGLDEGFMCTGTPSVRLGACVIAARVTCIGMLILSTTLARWCAAPRSRCMHLDVRYHCVRQYVMTLINVDMREISPTANLCTGTECKGICVYLSHIFITTVFDTA